MVTIRAIKAMSRQIAKEFRPLKIVLFGSYAYGRPGPASDVDLLVIMRFKGRPLHKSLEILNRVAPRFPIDLLARRPGDTARRFREGDPLIREALQHGVVLYEQDSRRVARQG